MINFENTMLMIQSLLNDWVVPFFIGWGDETTNIPQQPTNPTIPGEEQILESILPNVYVLISHIIATIILLTILICLVWKPTKKYIKARRELILKDVKEANEKNEQATLNFEQSKSELIDTKIKIDQMINDALKETEDIKSKAILVAKDDAKKIKQDAKVEIEKEKQIELDKINQKASLLAIDIAEKILEKKIDDKESIELVDSIINNLSNK